MTVYIQSPVSLFCDLPICWRQLRLESGGHFWSHPIHSAQSLAFDQTRAPLLILFIYYFFFPLRHLVRKWRWRISGSGDVSAWIFEVSSPGVPPGVAVGLGRPGWGGASPAQPAAGASAGRSFRFVGDGAVIPRKGCELGSAGFVYNAASDRQVKRAPCARFNCEMGLSLLTSLCVCDTSKWNVP